MPKNALLAGSTGVSVFVQIYDAGSTTGGGKTGLAWNTAGLTASYVRTRGLRTAITLATLANPDSAWTSGGFKEIDATNFPGLYRLDLPDLAVAAGADAVIVTLRGAANAVDAPLEIDLTATNPQNATTGGLAALPPYAHSAAGGLTAIIGTPAQASAVSALGTPAQAAAVAALGTPAQAADVFTATERNQIRHRLGLDGTVAAPLATPSLATAAAVSALGTPAQASAVAALGTPAQAADLSTLASIFAGITSLAAWLRLALSKTYTNATAAGEIGGSFAAATDSLEAIRDRGDTAWTTGTGGGTGTDPLESAVPGTYAPGTAGYRLGQIGTTTLNITSAINADGDLELIAGDDYNQADGRAITITNADGTWPDLTNAEIHFTANRSGARLLTFAGAVTTPTGTQTVTLEPTADDLPTPADAAPAWIYRYAVTARLANGHTVTLQTGTLRLIRAR